MIKYGTYIIFKCKNCDDETEVALHLKNNLELEKRASYCIHSWEEIGEKKYGETNQDSSKGIQFS